MGRLKLSFHQPCQPDGVSPPLPLCGGEGGASLPLLLGLPAFPECRDVFDLFVFLRQNKTLEAASRTVAVSSFGSCRWKEERSSGTGSGWRWPPLVDPAQEFSLRVFFPPSFNFFLLERVQLKCTSQDVALGAVSWLGRSKGGGAHGCCHLLFY